MRLVHIMHSRVGGVWRVPVVALGVIALWPALAVAQAGTGVLRVSDGSGSDAGSCGSTSTPCQTIQRAVQLALSGEEIRVAAGVYTGTTGPPDCTSGNIAVVCVIDKQLKILGGYTESDWQTADPVRNVTVIDGQDATRGILVEETIAKTASLELRGVTIRRGHGPPRTGDINAFGGGISAVAPNPQKLVVILEDVIFDSNRTVGAATGSGAGGFGAGGAADLRNLEAPSRLARVVFTGNEARGGTGPDRGGLAVGGALYTFQSNLTLTAVQFVGNTARAGSSPGSGRSGGLLADAQGGAAAFQLGSEIVGSYVVATDNLAVGGDAASEAGGAFAGALYGEGQDGSPTSVDLDHVVLERNVALGGFAATGGIGRGGGFMMGKWVTFVLDRAAAVTNEARTGSGTVNHGSGGGGGGAVTGGTSVGSSSGVIRNTLFADNRLVLGSGGGTKGGGGGGLFVQNLSTARLEHCTFAQNGISSSPLTGQAIAVAAGAGPINLQIDYTIISRHSEYVGAQAVFVSTGTAATFDTGLFADNDWDVGGGGAISGLGSMLVSGSAGFRSPGAPSYDYHLLPTSPAIDQATSSIQTVDIDSEARDLDPDIGADEQSSLLFRDDLESGTTWFWSLTRGDS
jgi:hypothetical protein